MTTLPLFAPSHPLDNFFRRSDREATTPLAPRCLEEVEVSAKPSTPDEEPVLSLPKGSMQLAATNSATRGPETGKGTAFQSLP